MNSSATKLTTYHRYLDTLPMASRQPTAGKDDVQLPIPLLAQLARPINSLCDVDSLVLELKQARARGCF